MEKTVELLKNIKSFLQKADDKEELKQLLKDFPEAERLIRAIDDYETVIGRLLREQKKDFIHALKNFLSTGNLMTGNVLVGAVLQFITEDALNSDDFDKRLSKESIKFLTSTISDLSRLIMASIDKDVAFNTLSQRTLTWIDEWSEELGRLMKLTTHEKLRDILREAIERGKSIQDIELELMELPEFSRARARRTAITEVLTACSVAQWESYMQSPAVTGKTWLHSGTRAINPRPHHVEMSGTTIAKHEYFDVNGYEALYPRDVNLPASERVNCHCVLAPSVDSTILGLSKEEKELIRARTMEELGM